MASPGMLTISWAYIQGLTFLLEGSATDNSSLRHTCHSVCFMSLLTQGKCQQCDQSCRNHLAFCLAKAGPRKVHQCRKGKSLSLGHDDPGWMYGLGDERLKSSLMERNLGVLAEASWSEPAVCPGSHTLECVGPSSASGRGKGLSCFALCWCSCTLSTGCRFGLHNIRWMDVKLLESIQRWATEMGKDLGCRRCEEHLGFLGLSGPE